MSCTCLMVGLTATPNTAAPLCSTAGVKGEFECSGTAQPWASPAGRLANTAACPQQ